MEFMTAEEKLRLEGDLKELYRKRNELIERIAEARAKGDLKENADYHAAREDASHNDAAIIKLEERLRHAAVADDSSIPADMVFVGATVKLRDLDTEDEDLYRLVGEARVAFDLEYIEVSVNSPMGQSLMRARIGETIRVDQPRGEKRFEIIAIVASI